MNFETKLNEIQDAILNAGDDYENLAEHRTTLSAIYSYYTEQLKHILKTKALGWRALREKHKSNVDAEAEWDSTEQGIKEMELRLDLKRVEKMMSSLKTLIDSQRTDYWNTPRNNPR